MSSDCVLAIRGLQKSFHLYQHTWQRLAGLVTRKKLYRDFIALDDISFELRKGEAMGILGENGSGKSTLLKIIAGILQPEKGELRAIGTVAGLLELGTGFNPELSGRRNIYLNATFLGMSREQVKAAEREIVEFAELDRFIDEPIKSYSSGMIMRLGFAIAIHCKPQCFIIDEALSVGDARFQQKCFLKMDEFRKAGGSVLFVSHDLNAIRVFCDRAMLMERGHIRFLGDPEEAVNRYYKLLAGRGVSGEATVTGYGNGGVRFVNAWITDRERKQATAIVSGQPMQIHFCWDSAKLHEDVTFGFTIRDRMGQDAFGINGALLGKLLTVKGPGEGCFNIETLNLRPGSYTISLAAHTGITHLENCYHWWDGAIHFEVLEDLQYRFCGITRMPVSLMEVTDEKAV